MNQNPLINACGGFFTDSGGIGGKYSDRENLFSTICKSGGNGTHVRLTFSQVDIAQGDNLCFFDGLDNSAPLLACASDYYNGFPFIVQATAANTSGCITVIFNSNGNGTANGWEANIDCIPACQLVQGELLSSIPSANPLDTGWIDICPGDQISFEGRGIYPQNDLIYTHSDATSSFEWDFGDGTVATGRSVSHVYNEPGGYKVILTITDQFGCANSNFINQRVRVASKPNFEINDVPNPVCLDQPFELSASVSTDNINSTIEIIPQSESFLFNGFRSDSLALPDGNGTSYETSIRFTDFLPGQVLTDIRDLQSICVNMEHSWLHDMRISITCPSGNTVLLQQQMTINEEVYLGQPNDNDDINPRDGVGADYCWTPTATNGTFTEFANRNDKTSPSKPYFLPSGTYNSFENLEALLGCPLNGDWTITVTDLWGQDNGWIFSWGIDIDPDLYPTLESFTPSIANIEWQDHPHITNQENGVISIHPQTVGPTTHQISITDEFGCTADTSITIHTLAPNHPDCINCEEVLLETKDITICEGETLDLESYIDPFALGTVTFQANPEYEFSFSNHPTTNPFESVLQVSNVNDPQILPNGENLLSICVDIESEYNADLSLTLVSPNGVNLQLSIENGGSSDGYINTCFTANAARSIQNAEGPFMGNYLPEEPLSNLAGTDVNGVWRLRVADDAGLASSDVNILKSWSMTFKAPTTASFEWSSTADLTCTNCTNPSTTPSTNSQYIFEKTFQGCTTQDTLNVQVISSNVAIPITDFSLENGEILINWEAVPDAVRYEIAVNGGAWLPANGDLSHTITGLTNGEIIDIQLKAIYSSTNCETTPVNLTTQYIFCDLHSELINTVLTTSCVEVADASVTINTTGGLPPYNYKLNDAAISNTNQFNNLALGSYFVLVQDASGVCADTIAFTVNEPPLLNLAFDTQVPLCSGDNNGRIEVLPSGGVGNYRIIDWSHSTEKTFEVNNLADGTYFVTVADNNNCEIIDTIELIEPSPLQALPTASPVVCNGENTGGASVKVTGGTPIYQYIWENQGSQTGANAINLPPGPIGVTVTDANGCQEETVVVISEPDEITVDYNVKPVTCSGIADAALEAIPAGGVPPYKFTWSTGQTNSFAFNLSPNTYFLTITDSRGCEKVFTPIVEDANSFVISTNSTPTLCSGDKNGTAEVNVIGGTAPYTYAWNDPDSQKTAMASNLLAGEYEISITDVMGCQTIENVVVEDAFSLNINATSTATTCPDRMDGMAQINIPNANLNELSFNWSTGANTSAITGLAKGWYTFTVTNNNNCSTIDSVEVKTPDAIKIDTIITKMPLCSDASNGEIIVHASGGTGTLNFLWNTGQISNNLSNASAGSYMLEIQDANACILNTNAITLDAPSPVIIATQKEDVDCFGNNTGLAIANARGGTPPYTYLWNDRKGQQDSIAANLIEGLYTIQVTDKNGCIANDALRIDQPTAAMAALINQTIISCYKEAKSAAEITVQGGTGSEYRYRWSNGSSTPIANNLSDTNYTITITDENNCELIDSILIQERDSIQINLANVEPTCYDSNDGSIAITSISGGNGAGQIDNYTINWSMDVASDQAFATNLKGDETYRITVSDQQGCSNSISRYLGNPDPTELFLQKRNISCFGGSDGLVFIENFISNAAIANYEWSHTTTNISDTASSLTAGNYSLSITDADGCIATSSIEIQEPSPIQINNVEIIPNRCNEDLKGQINLAVEGGNPTYSYQWSNGSTSKGLANVASGWYKLSITDASNCSILDSFNLIDPDALIGEIASESVSCFGINDGQLSIKATGGFPPYSYSIDGTNYNGISTAIGLASGNYRAYIKDRNDCIWQSELFEIASPEPFKAKIKSPRSILEIGDSIEISADFENPIGAVQFSWTGGNTDALDCSIMPCATILIKPSNNTEYELYAVDENGCEASDILSILVRRTKKVYVPTGFSPNNDGKNDRLIVHGRENAQIKSFKVFDRWGEVIFSSNEMKLNDPLSGWDGHFKGELLNQGVFAWLLEIEYSDGEREILKGNTTLIR